MNKNFRTAPVYDSTYGVDVVDGKGKVVINFRTYAAAKLYMDKIAEERIRVLADNNAQDKRLSNTINANLHRSKYDQLPLPEVHHKRPPQLVHLRMFAPGKAPALTPA